MCGGERLDFIVGLSLRFKLKLDKFLILSRLWNNCGILQRQVEMGGHPPHLSSQISDVLLHVKMFHDF